MNLSDQKLDRLLKEAYPPVEVSPDFTFRLWRSLLSQSPPVWKRVGVPSVCAGILVGLLAGLWTWTAALSGDGAYPPAAGVRMNLRLDLFGNAPYDSLAGAYLSLKGEDRT
ncbi:MAG: hypothetical protein NC910_03845 [Candidatus Omnitrophica bacterium]|nr:hypothetical protein [Candidatus Omnitrophota bacterium]